MGYEIKVSFDKWEEFLNFMSDLHNREIARLEREMIELEEKNFHANFGNLDGEEEDIDELMRQYPLAFENTLYKGKKKKDEIGKICDIAEHMAKKKNNFLKPEGSITTAYILSKIKEQIKPDKFFLALPMTIAALFRLKCGAEFAEGQSRPWQDAMDISLFLLTEYGFNARGIENAIEMLDEYNLIEIDKDYSEDKENPKVTYRATDELYNLLLPDEIAF